MKIFTIVPEQQENVRRDVTKAVYYLSDGKRKSMEPELLSMSLTSPGQ